jgi:predicted GH43/DUF377 family glycosyl hydrolase
VLRLIFLIFILVSCAKEEESPLTKSSADFSKLTHSCFQESSANAIVSSGDFFTNSHWNDPHILKENNQYIIYASSPQVPADNDVSIFRFTSSDGITWTQSPTNAILEKTASGWSSKAVETPAVIYFNGQYHLFYTAYDTANDSTKFRIGHATSSDGINFNADTNYLIGPSSTSGGAVTDFNHFVVGEPAPVIVNNTLYLYYSALGYHSDIDDSDATAGSIVQSIGVISTTDGTNWSTQSMAFRPDQSIYPRSVSGSNKWKGFSTPNAIYMNNKVYVFFTVVDESNSDKQVKLSYAYSNNGTTGWTQHDGDIFSISDFTWATEEVRSPALLLNGKTLHMWFAGHSLTPAPFTLGIGHSKCNL